MSSQNEGTLVQHFGIPRRQTGKPGDIPQTADHHTAKHKRHRKSYDPNAPIKAKYTVTQQPTYSTVQIQNQN